MTCRRGVALLTSLWLLVVLTALAAGVMAGAREGSARSRYRIMLRQAEWAAEGCLAQATAYPERLRPGSRDSLDLGELRWCRLHVESPAERLNVNTADREALRAVLGADALADALLDWRDRDDEARPAGAEHREYRAERRPPPSNAPIQAVSELHLVHGFERIPLSTLDELFTVEGDGRLDVNRAPLGILRSISWLSEGDLGLLDDARSRPPGITHVEGVLAALGAARAEALSPHLVDLRGRIAVRPTELVIAIDAGVGASSVRARTRLVVVPDSVRLAVLRRVSW